MKKLMEKRSFIMGIALVLLGAGAVGATDSSTRTQHVQCKGSGTFADGVETHIDSDGDGQSAVLDQGLENCTTGRFFFQEEVEWIPQPTVTTCPAGTTNEAHIDPTHGQQRVVFTNEKTSEQLFSKITSATLCINFSAFPFTLTASGQFAFIGGTGQYTGATGAGTFNTAGSYLMFGFKDNIFGGFGQFNFTNAGTLTLPHDNDE